MEFNSKEVKNIKEILTFLNNEFSDYSSQMFTAYHPRGSVDSYQAWHICCNNYLVYAGADFEKEDFDICRKAIKVKFPNLHITYVYLHDITLMIKRKEMSKTIILR